jgi:hypothetical protein
VLNKQHLLPPDLICSIEEVRIRIICNLAGLLQFNKINTIMKQDNAWFKVSHLSLTMRQSSWCPRFNIQKPETLRVLSLNLPFVRLKKDRSILILGEGVIQCSSCLCKHGSILILVLITVLFFRVNMMRN